MALRQLVLHLEDVLQLELNRLGPENRAGGRFEKLGVHANLSAGPEQRSAQHGVDTRFGSDLLQVHALVGRISGAGQRGAHDERLDAGERAQDRVRKTERQKVHVRIRTQHAERHGDQPGGGAHRHG